MARSQAKMLPNRKRNISGNRIVKNSAIRSRTNPLNMAAASERVVVMPGTPDR